jgi:hypothetical protein
MIAMGAHVTARVFRLYAYRPERISMLLQLGAYPNVVDERGVSVLSAISNCYDSFVHLLDFGCTIPKDLHMRALSPDHMRYAKRVAICRRALAAPVGACAALRGADRAHTFGIYEK